MLLKSCNFLRASLKSWIIFESFLKKCKSFSLISLRIYFSFMNFLNRSTLAIQNYTSAQAEPPHFHFPSNNPRAFHITGWIHHRIIIEILQSTKFSTFPRHYLIPTLFIFHYSSYNFRMHWKEFSNESAETLKLNLLKIIRE